MNTKLLPPVRCPILQLIPRTVPLPSNPQKFPVPPSTPYKKPEPEPIPTPNPNSPLNPATQTPKTRPLSHLRPRNLPSYRPTPICDSLTPSLPSPSPPPPPTSLIGTPGTAPSSSLPSRLPPSENSDSGRFKLALIRCPVVGAAGGASADPAGPS